MKITIYLITCVWMLLSGVKLKAQDMTDFKVIVNASNPLSSIKKEELSKLFLKKTTKWPNGKKVLCVDLAADSPIRLKFSKDIHDRRVWAIKAFWQRQIFAGRSVRPPEFNSEDKVLKYINENPTAIGYVAVSTSLDKLKVKVLKIEK